MRLITLALAVGVIGCGPIIDPGFKGSWNMKIMVNLPQHDSLIYESVLTISSVPDTGSYLGAGMCFSQNDRFILEGKDEIAHAVVTWNGTMTCFPMDLTWCHNITLDYQLLNFIYQKSTDEIIGDGSGRALDLDCRYSENITLTYQATVVQ